MIAHQQQRSVELVDIGSADHHDIGNFRHAIAAYIIFKAEFQQLVADFCRDIRQQSAAVLQNGFFDGFDFLIAGKILANAVIIFTGTDLFCKSIRTVITVNQHHSLGRIQPDHDLVSCKYPDKDQNQLHHRHQQNRGQIGKKLPASNETQLQIGDRVDTKHS